MYLRSIEMKGFKSFPERTKLEFSPGVSVIVGPNGSGKSTLLNMIGLLEAAGKAHVTTIAFRSGGWTDTDLKGAAEIYDGPADLLARYEGSLIRKMMGGGRREAGSGARDATTESASDLICIPIPKTPSRL